MPFPNFFTSVRLLQHPLAYSPAASPITPRTHLRRGSFNIWSPVGGTVDRRPGITDLHAGPTGRIRKTIVAEDGTLAATVYNNTTQRYEVWYKTPTGSWTRIPSKRSINNSQSPHEMLWIRRKLYIKGNPTADKFGSVIFDLDKSASTSWWGLIRPLQKMTFRPTGEWTSSGSDRVEPLIGARYTYTYVSTTGHESSSADFTDLSPKVSGRYPRLTIPAQPNTTDIPKINIYRSGDGGGWMFFVKQINNTGSVINWVDDNFVPNGNFENGINRSRPAPRSQQNDPPPTVEEGVIGVDPIERSSPMVLWGKRVMFAVGKNLYFSVDDEATLGGGGALEESFRGGSTLEANRATFSEEVVDLIATDLGVIIFTKKNTHILTGHRRSEIRVDLLVAEIGAFDRHCSASVGSKLYWLDQNLDLRFIQLRSELTEIEPDILSTPLAGDHREDTTHYFQLDAQLIPDYTFITIFSSHQMGTTLTPIPQQTDSKVFVFDRNREIWFPPWEIAASAIWERFHMASLTRVGQLRVGTYNDFGVDLASRIVFSSLTLIGEADLNISDVDFVFQNVNAVELVWVGADLTTQVRIGVDIYVGPVYNIANYTPTRRSNTNANTPIDMRRGTFWLLPHSRSTGRYFNLSVDIPASDSLWSLLNATLVFGGLGDSRSIQRS